MTSMTSTTSRTSATFGTARSAEQGVALVSELPAAGAPRLSLLARLRSELTARRQAREFELAYRNAGWNERGDLAALARRL